MAPAGSALKSDGATSDASTAPGRCFIHEATKPVRGRRSASNRPPARVPKVTTAMPRMVTSTSGDIAHLLLRAVARLDNGAGEAAREATDNDVPVARNEPRGDDGGKRGDEPGHEVGFALPHTEQQGDEGGGESEIETVFGWVINRGAE